MNSEGKEKLQEVREEFCHMYQSRGRFACEAGFFAVKRKEDHASALGQEELGEHSGTALGPAFSYYFISYLQPITMKD